jgi:hypothetical protein
MGFPAKTDDQEVQELRQRLTALPADRQARVLEGILTPGLRLRVLAEQVRGQVGPESDEDEAREAADVRNAVREVRRTITRGR